MTAHPTHSARAERPGDAARLAVLISGVGDPVDRALRQMHCEPHRPSGDATHWSKCLQPCKDRHEMAGEAQICAGFLPRCSEAIRSFDYGIDYRSPPRNRYGEVGSINIFGIVKAVPQGFPSRFCLCRKRRASGAP
jgi:hypothetical protein